MIRECDFCTNYIFAVGARAVYFTIVTGTWGSPIIFSPSIPLTTYKTGANQQICKKFCHNEVLCNYKVSCENDVIRLFQTDVNNFLSSPILTSRRYVMAAMGRIEKHAIVKFCRD